MVRNAAPMIAIGLDGFSSGWVAVTLAGDRRAIAFPTDIAWLADQTFLRAAVDMPIGLTEDGRRDCDRLARLALAPHSARVFSGARRWLFACYRDPDEANAEAERRGQSKVSRQLWHLGPKVMQVDAFVRANPQLDIRETHPELVFLRLYGEPLPSKHTPDGRALRRQLLIDAGFAELDTWLAKSRIGTGAKADDVLDACAAALAARDLAGCVPDGAPPRDSHGLAMQIWF